MTNRTGYDILSCSEGEKYLQNPPLQGRRTSSQLNLYKGGFQMVTEVLQEVMGKKLLDGRTCRGRVRWYDPDLGYGFIEPDEETTKLLGLQEDRGVFVHWRFIRGEDYRSLLSEQMVIFTLVWDEKRQSWQAHDVHLPECPGNGEHVGVVMEVSGGKIQIAPGCEIPGLPIGKPLDCWIDGPNGWQEGDKVKFWGVTLIMGGARASQVHPL